MDVLPIVGFILLYVFAATRDYFGARPWVAALVTAGFVPYDRGLASASIAAGVMAAARASGRPRSRRKR